MQRAKVTDAENKQNESNQKRNQMVFEIEKERARWQIHYDTIVSQKRELEDIIANLERRRDLLFKENERLKTELKNTQQSQVEKPVVQINGNKLGLALGNSLLSQTGSVLYGSAFNSRKGSKTGIQSQQMMGLKGIKNGLNAKFSTGSQNALGDPQGKYQVQM